MGECYLGQGYMLVGVFMILLFCFDVLNLYCVEVVCILINMFLIWLFEKVGFYWEGYVCNYLLINGNWQDYLLLVCLVEDYVVWFGYMVLVVEGILKDFL